MQPHRAGRLLPQLLQPVPLLEQLGLAPLDPLRQLPVALPAGLLQGLDDLLRHVLLDKLDQHRVDPVRDPVVDLPDQPVLPRRVAGAARLAQRRLVRRRRRRRRRRLSGRG
eukprot:SAG22_NODE_2142_length_2946_cov_22.869687_5_plen_110_part_01